MKKLIFMFIMVHNLSGANMVLNTDQISSIAAAGIFNICGSKTLVRFYNGDSACISESPSEVNQLIVTK